MGKQAKCGLNSGAPGLINSMAWERHQRSRCYPAVHFFLSDKFLRFPDNCQLCSLSHSRHSQQWSVAYQETPFYFTRFNPHNYPMEWVLIILALGNWGSEMWVICLRSYATKWSNFDLLTPKQVSNSFDYSLSASASVTPDTCKEGSLIGSNRNWLWQV